jgi:hypothetical protein
VVTAGLLADGDVCLDHLRGGDAGRRLRGPALMLPQQFAEPAHQLRREAAAVPPLEGRVYRLPGREIDWECTPLDPVLDHVRDSIAHRPQVMDHLAAHAMVSSLITSRARGLRTSHWASLRSEG